MPRQENGTNKSNRYFIKNIVQNAFETSDDKSCQEGMTKCPSKKNKKAHTLHNYSTTSTKTARVETVEKKEKATNSDDIRFQIIEKDEQLQKEMNPHAYCLV